MLFDVSRTHEAIKGFVLSLDLLGLEATVWVKLRSEIAIIHLVWHIKPLVCVEFGRDNLGLRILNFGR